VEGKGAVNAACGKSRPSLGVITARERPAFAFQTAIAGVAGPAGPGFASVARAWLASRPTSSAG